MPVAHVNNLWSNEHRCDCESEATMKCTNVWSSVFRNLLPILIVFRLLAPGQTAKSKNVYSYKYILDCVKQNQLLDLSSYRLVHVYVML